jgi:hypothetical protein
LTRRFLDICLWCVAGLGLALAFAFVAYDIGAFQSRLGRIDSMVAAAAPAERHPSDALRRLLLTEFARPSQPTARILIGQLQVPYYRGLGWHRTLALWSLLVRLHLTDDERMAILASRIVVVRGTHGFATGAELVFARPLERLNEEELATLVVMARKPLRFARPEYRERIHEWTSPLLERARARR